VTKRRTLDPPQAPDLPDELDPAPAELTSRAAWDGVEATESTAVPEQVADAQLRESRWQRADLLGRRLTGLQCLDVEFVNCDLSGAMLSDAQLTRVTFERCRASGLVLSGATLQDVRFVDCKADGIDFRMAKLRRTAAEQSVLREADFYRAQLNGVRLVDCDLGAASFQETRTDGLALHGSSVDELRGATALAGAQIDQDQVLMLGALLVAELGFRVRAGD
jgi:uncharacterized protein YjbI with pentapeptide repeats